MFDFLLPMKTFLSPFISTIMLDFSELFPCKHAIQSYAIAQKAKRPLQCLCLNKRKRGKPPNEEQITERMISDNHPSHSLSSPRRNSNRVQSEWAWPKQKYRSSFHLLPSYCILDFLPITKTLSCSSKLIHAY